MIMRTLILFTSLLIAASTTLHSQTLFSNAWGLYDDQQTYLGSISFFNDTMFFEEPGIPGSIPYATFDLSISGNTIIVEDILGTCPDPGMYHYDIVQDTLHFTVVDDDCLARVQNYTGLHWVAITMSMEEADHAATLHIFPNPAEGIIELRRDTPETMILRVHDLSGRCVHGTQVTGHTVVLDLGHLPKGKYLITGKSGDRNVRQQVVLR
jgi:hypothetical protein